MYEIFIFFIIISKFSRTDCWILKFFFKNYRKITHCATQYKQLLSTSRFHSFIHSFLHLIVCHFEDYWWYTITCASCCCCCCCFCYFYCRCLWRDIKKLPLFSRIFDLNAIYNDFVLNWEILGIILIKLV